MRARVRGRGTFHETNISDRERKLFGEKGTGGKTGIRRGESWLSTLLARLHVGRGRVKEGLKVQERGIRLEGRSYGTKKGLPRAKRKKEVRREGKEGKR